MREFNRMAQLNGILSGIMDETAGDALPLELQLEHGFINLLFGDDEAQEALGTIQDAAFHERTMTRVSAGTVSVQAELIEDDALRMALISYYKWNGFNVYLTRNRPQGEGAQMLGSYTETYDYALLDGRRITSTTHSKRLSAGSSIIQIHFDDVSEGSGEPEIYAGEVRSIFKHKQSGVPSSEHTLLVYVAWMKPSQETPLDDGNFIWNKFPELSVESWLYEQYAQSNDPKFPPTVIPLSDVECQVSRGKITYTDIPMWITTSMDRFPTSFSAYGMGNATGEDN
ncbi:hypothetical protein C8J57DRAFT_1468984 [Mycena rebaudengoi]|nr:hypothetical protein C8J57DRAFT_1468984 [Mycena rebaudengoi]